MRRLPVQPVAFASLHRLQHRGIISPLLFGWIMDQDMPIGFGASVASWPHRLLAAVTAGTETNVEGREALQI